jgi:hypothetical protein
MLISPERLPRFFTMIHLESLVGNAFQANLGKNFQQFSQGWIKGFEMASQNNFRCKFFNYSERN